MQMMMVVGLSCAACLCLASVAGGAWFMYKSPATTTAPTTTTTTTTDTDTASGDVAGMKQIKNGGLSLVVDPKSQNSKSTWFEDTQENLQHVWEFVPVPNKDETYYISSQQRQFKKGNNTMYLTAPATSNCSGSPTVDKPVYADRQYWKVIPSGDGYQLASVACLNRRAPPYLMSSGARAGNKKGASKGRTATFSARSGSVYSLVDASTE